MRASSIIALLFALLTLSACQPTVDASSEESFKASMQEVRDSLPEDKQEALMGAMIVIALDGMDMPALMAGDQASGSLTAEVKDKLDGKTGEEILKMADEARERRAQALD